MAGLFSETAIRDCGHAKMTQRSFRQRDTPANEGYVVAGD
jgi:hypothetical protein